MLCNQTQHVKLHWPSHVYAHDNIYIYRFVYMLYSFQRQGLKDGFFRGNCAMLRSWRECIYSIHVQIVYSWFILSSNVIYNYIYLYIFNVYSIHKIAFRFTDRDLKDVWARDKHLVLRWQDVAFLDSIVLHGVAGQKSYTHWPSESSHNQKLEKSTP